VGGGVSANLALRHKVRTLVKTFNGSCLFPYDKSLNGDNAAMIGIAAYFRSEKNIFVDDFEKFKRNPRLYLGEDLG
jgi:tRNA A37 threonylcarbamoyltransferase TsaD